MSDQTQEFKALGKASSGPSDELETFKKPLGVCVITFESAELLCSCPVTGQPDLYQVSIEYGPRELCLESKSLKLYLWTFRNKQMFGEALASEIACKVFQTLKPLWVKVMLTQAVRGGLEMTAEAYFDH